jgi:hypothetical protein
LKKLIVQCVAVLFVRLYSELVSWEQPVILGRSKEQEELLLLPLLLPQRPSAGQILSV